MKTTALFGLLAMGATAATASSVAERSPEAWCLWVGQPCWKVKRVAEAFHTAIKDTRDLTSADVSSAGIARRGVEVADAVRRGLDDLAGIVASTQKDPRSFYGALNLGNHTYPPAYGFPYSWDNFPFPPAVDPTATPAATKDKREPAPAPAPADSDSHALLVAKRAAEAIVRSIEGFHADPEVSKRDFAPLPVYARDEESFVAAAKREASPEAGKIEPKWCLWVGQPCWKRDIETRCHAPGEACAMARRDLHAMHNAARNVLDMVQ